MVAHATPNTTDALFETVVEFTCNLGYVRDGVDQEDMAAICTATSEWSHVVPDCIRKYLLCSFTNRSIARFTFEIMSACDVSV